MQITPEQLLAEAGRMALEIRLKDQLIETLQAEIARLNAAQDNPEGDSDAR